MRWSSATVALVGVAALAGCSSDGEPAADPGQAASAAAVGWSPCDGVDASMLSRDVGEEMSEQTGTPEQPRCAFTPVRQGGPAFDVNYLWFDGELTDALDSMGTVAGTVRDIDVPGADAARLVVHARKPSVFVTGFVQAGGLVQSVNAVQLRPYDEQSVVRATTTLLAALVRAAPDQPS